MTDNDPAGTVADDDDDEPYTWPTPAEHLAWAVERAREYLDNGGNPEGALHAAASLSSDLQKHPGTRALGAQLGAHPGLTAVHGGVDAVRRLLDDVERSAVGGQ